MDKNVIINAAVKAVMGKPFTWGSSDCCTFVCDTLMGIDHPDYMVDLRGRYSDEDSSAKILLAYAGGGLVEAAIKMAAHGGLVSVSPIESVDPELGIISSEMGPMLALFHKDKWLARSELGVSYVPRCRAVLAWARPVCQF